MLKMTLYIYSKLYYIMHGWRENPDTFSHNKQTVYIFELAQGKIASAPFTRNPAWLRHCQNSAGENYRKSTSDCSKFV